MCVILICLFIVGILEEDWTYALAKLHRVVLVSMILYRCKLYLGQSKNNDNISRKRLVNSPCTIAQLLVWAQLLIITGGHGKNGHSRYNCLDKDIVLRSIIVKLYNSYQISMTKDTCDVSLLPSKNNGDQGTSAHYAEQEKMYWKKS